MRYLFLFWSVSLFAMGVLFFPFWAGGGILLFGLLIYGLFFSIVLSRSRISFGAHCVSIALLCALGLFYETQVAQWSLLFLTLWGVMGCSFVVFGNWSKRATSDTIQNKYEIFLYLCLWLPFLFLHGVMLIRMFFM